MKHTFSEPRFDQLQPTGDEPLLLDVPILNHQDIDTILVGANWRVFEPLVAMTVETDTIHIVRRDGKPLDIVRVEDDDSFTKPTQQLPLFQAPLPNLVLRKSKEGDKWLFDTKEHVPITDRKGAVRFRQWIAQAAIEAQQAA